MFHLNGHILGVCAPVLTRYDGSMQKNGSKYLFTQDTLLSKNYFFVSITLRFPKCILITSCFLSLFARPLYFHQSIIILFKIIYFLFF